MTSSEK